MTTHLPNLTLIFHMSIPCDKNFPWVRLFLTLWPWPGSLTHYLKTLTLPITFEQWVLELWYFTWVFIVIGLLRGYHYFLICDLDLGFDPFFENFNLANNFETVSARALIFHILHIVISCDKIFLLVSKYLSLWSWPSLELAIIGGIVFHKHILLLTEIVLKFWSEKSFDKYF